MGLASRPGGPILRPPVLLGGAALAGLLAAGLLLFRGELGVGRGAPDARGSGTPPRAAEHGLETPDEGDVPARLAEPARANASAEDAEVSAPELEPYLVRGRVVDARDRPVLARVLALAGRGLEGVPLESLDPAVVPWSPRKETLADAEGRFSVERGAGGGLRLGVRARGFAPYERELPADVVDLGTLVLQQSAVLEGHVRDASGTPVAGAVLRRLDPGARQPVIHGAAPGVPVATTDARGVFRVDELASGPWELLITSAEHPDRIERGATAAPGELVSGLEFVLEPGLEIQGRVVGAPPEALADLWVEASVQDAAAGRGAPRRVRCAPDGSFAVRGLPAGATCRLAAVEGEPRWSQRPRTPWVEARAGERGVVLVYQAPTALIFQVVDAVTGEPVTELDVRCGRHFLLPATDPDGRVQRSFPEGRVRFENLFQRSVEEDAELRVEALGYATLLIPGLELGDGRTLDLGVLRLTRAALLAVQVLDHETGAPVPEAVVRLVEALPGAAAARGGPEDESFVRSACTDREGKVRLNGPSGGPGALVVRHPGFAPLESEALEPSAFADRELTLRLRVGGSVLVEVVDAGGAPVPGARIHHRGPGAEDASGAGAPGAGGSRWSDGRGRQRFEHLPAGLHGFRTDGASWSEVLLGDGGEETLRLTATERADVPPAGRG